MINKIILPMLLIFFFPLLNAAGLQIVGENSFDINKTIGVDDVVIFKLRNSDSFTFHNISFEENDFISMNPINNLTSGQEVNITATIYGNQPINQPLKIIGLYEAQIGNSNETYNVDVEYNNGITPCNLQVIKGDSVVWNNLVLDDVKMINADTSSEITTIAENSTYKISFNTPEVLNYHFTRYGFKFTNNCQLISLNDVGLINNPLLDTSLNFNINPNYDPTEIEVTILESSYIMDNSDENEGVMTIKNIGDKIAKSVKLSGEWFSFSQNNFDLNPGQTKGITYTINPYIYITQTSETNKTYDKTMLIEGNFDDYTSNFNIFINYANLDNQNSTGGFEAFKEMLDQYCEINPNDNMCPKEPQVIYKYVNESNQKFNVTYEREQVKGIYSALFGYMDDSEINNNLLKEQLSDITTKLNQSEAREILNTEKIESLEKKTESKDSVLLFFGILVIFLVIIGLIYLVYNRLKIEDKKDILKRFFRRS